MKRNEIFLNKANELLPDINIKRRCPEKTVTFEKTPAGEIVAKDGRPLKAAVLKKGESICFDFGEHLVGHAVLSLGYEGSHPDAPAWLRLKFAEMPCELFENALEYNGWISTGWIQEEQIHIDVLPAKLNLPRRYAFRYLMIEVLDVSSKYSLTVNEVSALSQTSADKSRLVPYNGEYKELDAIACSTLESCMQEVFEDGPKRDRRLWIGDLRIQALVNYATYKNYDLVKRCLYLFAGSTYDDGRISACIFTEPEDEADDTAMFDYSLLFIPTLLDYVKETGDTETAKDLWPLALKQIELSQSYFDEANLVNDSDALGWCFIDWNLNLNKQAGAQGVYLYCVKAAIELAGLLKDEKSKDDLIKDYALKKEAARILWDDEKYVFVSGKDRQISFASQVWMVLGGALNKDESAGLLCRIENMPEAENIITPYMMHNYIDALIASGLDEKALEKMTSYWGGMEKRGADTFWEMYNPENPDESPYGGTIVNSYCHAWSCGPAYFLRKKFFPDKQ